MTFTEFLSLLRSYIYEGWLFFDQYWLAILLGIMAVAALLAGRMWAERQQAARQIKARRTEPEPWWKRLLRQKLWSL